MTHFSKHANMRKQQRCISNLDYSILEAYGEELSIGKGIVKLYLKKKDMPEIRADLGKATLLKNIYCIKSKIGNVITIAHMH